MSQGPQNNPQGQQQSNNFVLQKPRQRSTRFSETSKRMSRIPRGNHVIRRDGPSLDLVRPVWKGKPPTVIRILPNFNPDEPNGPFDKTRLSHDEKDFSDWCRIVPVAKYVGISNKVSFITHDRMTENDGYAPYQENPYHVLYSAIKNAVKNGTARIGNREALTPEWNPLVLDQNKKVFNAPTSFYYVQALVIDHNDECYVKNGGLPKGVRKGDLPQVVQLSKSAGDGLVRKLGIFPEGYNGTTEIEKQADMYSYGDLVDLKTGGYVTIYNPEEHSNIFDKVEGEIVQNPEADQMQFKGWRIAISDNYTYYANRQPFDVSNDISGYETEIRNRMLWWDDILTVPSHEMICTYLAQAFGVLPDLLHFGWADHPEFFTDEVNGILNNRVNFASSEMPSARVDGQDTGGHAVQQQYPGFESQPQANTRYVPPQQQPPVQRQDPHTYDPNQVGQTYPVDPAAAPQPPQQAQQMTHQAPPAHQQLQVPPQGYVPPQTAPAPPAGQQPQVSRTIPQDANLEEVPFDADPNTGYTEEVLYSDNQAPELSQEETSAAELAMQQAQQRAANRAANRVPRP